MKIFLSLLVLSLLPVSQAYALRCNHQSVQVGDYKFDVIHLCGQPDYIERRYADEGTRLRSPNRSLEITKFKDIVIEEWTYNFGANKLMRLLIFKNGVLKKIDALGYGY